MGCSGSSAAFPQDVATFLVQHEKDARNMKPIAMPPPSATKNNDNSAQNSEAGDANSENGKDEGGAIKDRDVNLVVSSSGAPNSMSLQKASWDALREAESPPLTDFVDSSAQLKLCLRRKALKGLLSDFVIRTVDGTEFLRLEPRGRGAEIMVTTMAKEPIAMLKGVQRGSVVRFEDDFDTSEPHLYIYSFVPRIAGQESAESTREGKPLYIWARVHTNSGRKPKFSISMVSRRGGKHNYELFAKQHGGNEQADYTGKTCDSTKIIVTKKGVKGGACTVDEAWSGAEGVDPERKHCLTIAAGIDPVLMLCAVMCMDSLGS